MRRTMAESLARALDGRVVADGVRPNQWAVETDRTITRTFPGPLGKPMSRAESRVILIDEDSAASYGPLRDDPRGDVDGTEWDDWGSMQWAVELVRILGGEAIHLRRNIWTVNLTLADGRYVSIGDESASVFPSVEAFAACEDSGAEHFDFV